LLFTRDAGFLRAERRTRFPVDDRLPRPVGVHRSGRAVDNKISYTLPDDAPFRTLVGATTVQGPRAPSISAPERDRPPRSPTSVERQSTPGGATVAR